MKFLNWVETKAVPAVARWWKPVAIVLLVIAGVILGKRLVRFGAGVVNAILGKVDNGTFSPIEGDPVHVTVPVAGGGHVVVKLPVDESGKQIVSSDPNLRVGYAPGYAARADNTAPVKNRKG